MSQVRAETPETVAAARTVSPSAFDVVAWTRQACEASGVSFAVTDPVVLRKLDHLIRHPA
ncbi:hypothetical protein [Microbacterium sp. 18062]|uniref:hypothetical protein n=1 Tax=Microbacterium sp. 18062 TaxID=2681410 RepID=UPI0013575EF9|nr:hypothetical protein [Microbacterium sp. 18062]